MKTYLDCFPCFVDQALKAGRLVTDAVASGLHRVAELISSGSTAPGAVLRLCNDEFIERSEQAEMIISKGQGNYEALSNVEKKVFFLLKAKCKMISKNLGVNQKDIVFYSINADRKYQLRG
ncbi:MAG: DUF89 family protein [Bacteroidales bacterium]|nr:DUF89 family protein [Bacteroidales bacterium]